MTEQTTLAPIRRSITVPRPVEDAFRLYTEGMSSWWPLRSYSVGEDQAESVALEGRVGGRIYERTTEGREHDWGRVLVWEPPTRVVYSWQPEPSSPAPTEVEIRFIAEDEGWTRVELEHRGWERLGAVADRARASYDTGWITVLGRYEEVAGT